MTEKLKVGILGLREITLQLVIIDKNKKHTQKKMNKKHLWTKYYAMDRRLWSLISAMKMIPYSTPSPDDCFSTSAEPSAKHGSNS